MTRSPTIPDRGWYSTYLRVRAIDDHLRYHSGITIVIKGPPGTAGGGWVTSNAYPGVTRRAARGSDQGRPAA